eukprot:m.255325 g.255325  ORF g.255325 m.255325 type:complete len:104 (+) comp15946_c0_seq1:357-668(+)
MAAGRQNSVVVNDEETFGFGTVDKKSRRSSALHHQIEDELRHEIEEDERTIRTTREFLGVTMFVLLLSVVANFGFTWYAARVLNSAQFRFSLSISALCVQAGC